MTSISFVINTYNRANYLPNTLRALKSVKHDRLEVVVVNGPSTDATEDVLREWSSEIKIGRCPEPNLSQSRNIGIALASGDVIAFIDDDAVPHPLWAQRVLDHYGHPRIGGVGGFTVDNTGVRFQVCKTVCDRFGNAYNVSEFFDERALNSPGSFYYPSMLGTNSTFRASALREIGGFDETFAYLLDETDVCLRLVDAGYRVIYEPEAIVFHQFAPSHIRSERRIARTLYPSAVSKSYFIQRHGAAAAPDRVQAQLESYRDEILEANEWFARHGDIAHEHRASLDRDLIWGIEKGTEAARLRYGKMKGDLVPAAEEPSFRQLPGSQGLRIAFVSRGYPPAIDAGIARWTQMMAEGLAAIGNEVHVICEAIDGPSTNYQDGVWIHRIANTVPGEQAQVEDGLPSGIATWAMAVDRAIAAIRSFGLDVISFPIWDLEGFRALHLRDVGVVLSLHTSYALAKPFKPEWSARPIFEHLTVEPMIAREAEVLGRAPVILANSAAIIRDMEAVYGVQFADRVITVPHGTKDPLAAGRRRETGPAPEVRVAFVGRFEPRKGFDIAAKAFAEVLNTPSNVRITIAGDELNGTVCEQLERWNCGSILGNARVEWKGYVDREALDDLYAGSDIVVMPSRYESFGLVAIEAMAAGACVIALSAGGLAEVVEDGVTGFAVPPDSDAHHAIAGRISELAQAPERMREMQRRARTCFEQNYTVETMVTRAHEVYRHAATKGREHADA